MSFNEHLNQAERTLRAESKAIHVVRRLARTLAAIAEEDRYAFSAWEKAPNWRQLVAAFDLDPNDPNVVAKLKEIAKGID